MAFAEETYSTLLSKSIRLTGLRPKLNCESRLVFASYLPWRDQKESLVVGQQFPYVVLKNSFSSALNKAGISDFRFHDLRHTFASQMVMNGTDLNTVRALLGQKSIKMTLRYAHPLPTDKKKAIELIDAAFSTPQVTRKLTHEQKDAVTNFVTLTN